MKDIPKIKKLLYPAPKLKNGYKIIFADDVASGRPCKKIEKKIAKRILPYYANTHSNAYCGILMKKLIQKTREYLQVILNIPKTHKILFTGNGCTGAINHLVNSIDYLRYDVCNIYITPYEHYSNYLPWVEIAKKYSHISIIIFSSPEELHLNNMKSCLNIISITAASNVSGKITDINEIINIKNQFKNTFLFLDMACSAPYVNINIAKMQADAVFISPHKFLGGPGSSGILIANEQLFTTLHPYCPGGGCVKNANSKSIIYENTLEKKEVGGTPNIIGIIKIGYIFRLKEKLFPIIEHNEAYLTKYIYSRFYTYISKYGIVVIDPYEKSRLPIVAFSIPDVHYNYIVALLNDLFSIQSRGGINCCGLLAEKTGLKGWCRLSFNYLMSQETVDFILESVEYICINWRKYLDSYKYLEDQNLFIKK